MAAEPKRPPGRPLRLLEPGVRDRLIEATRAGAPITVAADYAGIHAASFSRWMQRGWIEDQRLGEETQEPDPDEAEYLTLFRDIQEARATAAVRAVVLINKVAAGGTVIEETQRKYRDSEGHVVTETTQKKQAPDWRAAAFYLERQHRNQYGKSTEVAVEVSGPGGGPMQVTVDTVDLASRIRENIAAQTAQLQIAPASDLTEDIIDGEVLPDPQ